MKKYFLQSLGLAGLLALSTGAFSAPYASNVSINGYPLSTAELATLEANLGTRVMPGAYLYNQQNGCWLNTTTGYSGCLNNSGMYTSRYGSGERNANGDWSHYSDMTDGAVGGTGDGCVYAFGWSNC
ncbi:MAG: hypothetical protein H6970_06825 [Gammaproteobacteria bacterium]|nr:hypothetical protein [Gammaproteobacteria bacterium]MCP5459197.1 hypothetical protein [Gammaproteobacteria bacterium]